MQLYQKFEELWDILQISSRQRQELLIKQISFGPEKWIMQNQNTSRINRILVKKVPKFFPLQNGILYGQSNGEHTFSERRKTIWNRKIHLFLAIRK
jgi:hypothetical protein